MTTHRLLEMKKRGEKISMLTAYDFTMGNIVDKAGIDIVLVGDSASNVMCGNITTLPITLDQMIFFGKSVVRGVKRALVVVDMPFGSYQGNSKEALASIVGITMETAEKIQTIINENVEVVEDGREEPAEAIPEAADVYECPDCGSHVSPEMTRCPNCGVELSFEYEDDQET